MCEIKRIVGFQKDIKGGLVFSRQSTLFYLAGQTGIFHSLKDNTQKFLPIIEKNEFTSMTLGPKNLLALASKGQAPKIMIYSLKSQEKYHLPNPNSFNSTEYVHVTFSEDCEYLAAQGGFPSWPFVMWQMEKRCVVLSFVPFRLELGAKVFKFIFYPQDHTNIVAVGRYFLRVYHYKDGNLGKIRFKEDAFHELERSQKTFHCLTWIQNSDKFAVGTSDGIILIFQRKQLIQQVILKKKLADVPRIHRKLGNLEDKNITCILSLQTGIICSYGGNSALCLHWKVDKKDFNIVASVHIPKRLDCDIEDSKIVQLSLNSNEDTLAAATDDGQILVFSLTVSGLLGCIGYEAEFDAILDQQHRTPVIYADTAVNRSVHVTCSTSTLLLWDYRKRQLLLWKKFDEEIRSVAIHPLGINLLLGFKDVSKMYNILCNKLEEVQHFDTKSNWQISFSKGGHLIAIANASRIELYTSLSFEKHAEFDGEMKCLIWKDNDNRLLSTDKAGNIYEWDVALKKEVWSYSSTEKFRTLAVFNDSMYAATSDSKVWVFNNYKKTADVDTHGKVTSLLATKYLLLAGNENGLIFGYKLPLSENAFFETYCHHGRILNMTIKEEGRLLLVTGKDSAISMWKIDGETEKYIPLFDETFIERKSYEENVNMIAKLEKELKNQLSIADAKKTQQLQLQETERAELEKHYEDVQNQLKQTIIVLTKEKHNLQIDMKKSLLDEEEALSNDRDKNYADFQTKLLKEEEHFKKLGEERVNKIESYEWQLFNLKEEIKSSNEKAQAIREKNEIRLKELENLLVKELDTRQEIMKITENFYRNLEEKAKSRSEETNFKFLSDLQKARDQNQFLTSEVERINAELCYEKECSRTLDSEFGKKKQMYDGLRKIAKHIKNRISRMDSEIERKESLLEDKVAMIKVLEDDAKEIEHLSSEVNWKLEERKKMLQEKVQEMSKLLIEQEKIELEQRQLARKLKVQQREQFLLNEKLKSTEKSINDITQKVLKSQLLLERYRKEFIEATKDIDNSTVLRGALLCLLDKRRRSDRVKEEEVFVGDTDPFMKFCRQRDHYESLINTVLNRKQEIEASFRSTYVNLAKESSDWAAFAEALRSDICQKQERIKILEMAVKLPAKYFSKDPVETQRRFNNVYESLKSIEKQEDTEIQKRMDLIEVQTKELQRLHGLLVVEERGRIIRKIAI